MAEQLVYICDRCENFVPSVIPIQITLTMASGFKLPSGRKPYHRIAERGICPDCLDATVTELKLDIGASALNDLLFQEVSLAKQQPTKISNL